jgi:thymidylate synthase ThyX
MRVIKSKEIYHPKYNWSLGVVELLDIGESRTSPDHAKKFIADIASISYGNEEAKDPAKLFDRLIRMGHLSCLEFVPVPMDLVFEFSPNFSEKIPLPMASLRRIVAENPNNWENEINWGEDIAEEINKNHYAFRITCYKDTNVQWLRHRNASYLELSRRYVKDSKVPFKFNDIVPDDLIELALNTYHRLLSEGYPPEQARKVVPFGFETTFYVAGNWETYWENFFRLRTDAHSQSDIQTIALAMQEMIMELRV